MAKSKKIVKQKKVLLIKKANELIQAQYKFDIWETRAFLSVLAQIQRSDEEFKQYRIVYKNIMEDFDLKAAEAYNLLREAVFRLMSKRVHIKYEKDGVFRENIYTIFNKANALSNENEQKIPINYDKQGYIDIAMHPDMRDLLLQLKKNFTTYDIKHITQLGVYAVRIYELLKQYERIGQRKIGVDKIKQMFELIEEYPLFANFYQKIITPSIKEINKYTDLQVDTPQKIKEGRKVVALLFTFRKKEMNGLSEVESSTDFKSEVESVFETLSSAAPITSVVAEPTIPLYKPQPIQAVTPDPTENLYLEFEGDVVKGFGVTPFVLVQLLQNYDAELIRKQIRITKRKRGSSPTTNIAGFFVNAVKTDYNDPDEAKEEKKRAKQQQLEAARIKAEKKQQLTDDYNDTFSVILQGIKNTIRKLVAHDATITNRAIEVASQNIRSDRHLLRTFEQSGYHFDALDLEMWRKEDFLREQIYEAMQQLEPKAFAYLLPLKAQLKELEEELEELRQ